MIIAPKELQREEDEVDETLGNELKKKEKKSSYTSQSCVDLLTL